MKNTCFFCKNLFKVEFRRSRFFRVFFPYASEGKIDIFGSQKHVFFAKTYLGFIYFWWNLFFRDTSKIEPSIEDLQKNIYVFAKQIKTVNAFCDYENVFLQEIRVAFKFQKWQKT